MDTDKFLNLGYKLLSDDFPNIYVEDDVIANLSPEYQNCYRPVGDG